MRISVGTAHLLSALLLLVLAVSCGGDGSSDRYGLEKQFFDAEQAWSKAILEQESGVATSTTEMRAQLEAVLEAFDAQRPNLGPQDTVIFAYAANAAHNLSELLASESQWNEVARHEQRIATDTLFPLAARHRALFGWARACEANGQLREACELYRQLTLSFYPPVTENGVNTDVLSLPSRRVVLAEGTLPESLASFRAYGERYYDSLATAYPHSQLGFQALGELAKLQGQDGRWDAALATLARATDSAGQMFPAYRIDRGEILASQKHDTATALKVFADVASELPKTPFRVDADMKTAAILYRRGKYAQVQTLLTETKRDASGGAETDLGVGLLLARSFAEGGNRDRARAEYTYLVTTYPSSLQAVEAAASLAALSREMNDSTGAQAWLTRADSLAYLLAADPAASPQLVAAALNARATFAVESKHWDDAALHLAAIAQTFGAESPMGASALVRLGYVQLRQLKDTLAAGRSWQSFITAHPEHPDGATLKAEMNKWPERYRTNPPS